jgi:phage terminase small subunit
MGSRGPIARPGGRRAERRKKAPPRPPGAPQALEPPEWLPGDLRDRWDRTVGDLQRAGVRLEAVDAQAVGHFVLVAAEAVKAAAAGDTRTAARLGRDALQWANQIGATPAARMRMNLEPPEPAEPDLWDLLAMPRPSR